MSQPYYKRGPLSKIEKYCIAYMMREKFPIEWISEELNRNPEFIKKYVESSEYLDVPEKPSKVKTIQEEHKAPNDNFIRSSVGGRKGVTAMTPEQSMAVDAARERHKHVRIKHGAIHSIR